MLVQIQLDDLGIDYIDRRNGLIDAVTLEDAKPRRQAAARRRHAGHGGRPAQGFDLEGAGRLSSLSLSPLADSRADKASDGASSNRSITRGRPASPTCWRAPARRSPGCARAMPTARCRCCGCRSKRDDLAAILGYAALLRDGTTDVVFLGTGGSSLGGQTLAQLAGHAVPGRRELARSAAHPFHGQSRSRTATARCCSGCRCRPARFVAISKSGGTGETLMQTIAALAALKARQARSARSFPRHHRAGQARQGQRPARSAFGASRSAMLDHDPGVGGRFSVLTNVGLLPAAVCGLDIGAIRAGAADALAPVLGRQAAGRGAGRGRRGARGRARRAASRSR